MAYPHATLGQALRNSARRWPDDPFLVGDGGRLSFAEVDAQVDDAARGLWSLGVRRGDAVALWMPNLPDWVVAALACARIGAVIVPINTRYKTGEAAHILRQSRATALIMVEEYWDVDYFGMVTELVPELSASTPSRLQSTAFPHLRTVILRSANSFPGTVPFANLPRPADTDEVEFRAAVAAVSPDDTAVVVFTSGTTGASKGAMHSHAVIRNCSNIARELHIEHGDRVLGHMPFYHIAGLCTEFIPALMLGCPLYPITHWKPGEVAELIATERITIFGGIPTHFVDLIDELTLRPRDTSCLKSAWIGGASVTPEIARKAKDVLQLDALQAVYGMTETTSTTTLSRFEDPIEVACDNRGLPVGEFEVIVADPETGESLPAGRDGEVRVRGHLVMEGYLHDPAATAAAITTDGWFKTGDLGRFDEEGYLKIVGRLKDMFIVGGSNAYPAEIEKHIQTHPGVRQVAVVGVPDARLGEVGFAFVEAVEGTALAEEDVIDHCRGALADYKVPRFVRIVSQFPLTSTGKIQRGALAGQAKQATETVGGRQ